MRALVARQPRRSVAQCLVLVSVLPSLLIAARPLAVSVGRAFLIAPAHGPQARPHFPAISDHLVVWLEYGATPHWTHPWPYANIYGRDLATGRQFAVTTRGTAVSAPSLSGHLVVWADCRHCSGGKGIPGYGNTRIYGKDLATGREFLISPDQGGPIVSGHRVVWVTIGSGGEQINGQDLATGRMFHVSGPRQAYDTLALSGSLVVWAEFRGGRYAIYGKDLSTGRMSVIAAPTRVDLHDPVLDGHIVVWTRYDVSRRGRQGSDLVGKDLATGRTFQVTHIPPARDYAYYDLAKAVGDHVVVWTEAPAGSPTTFQHVQLHGKDLATGATFVVTPGTSTGDAPAISANRVVWTNSSGLWGAVLTRH